MSADKSKVAVITEMNIFMSNMKSSIDVSSHWMLENEPKTANTNINGKPAIIFYWPAKISIHEVGGYKLSDGRGYICMSQTYEYTNLECTRMKKVAHVYKYVASDTVYHMTSTGHPVEDVKNYGFHFDEDLSYDTSLLSDADRHPSAHIQVIHSHPRFATQENLIMDFFKMVKRTCFSDDGQPYSEPVYSINSVR